MYCTMNENILIEKTSWVLTSGFLSSKKKVGVGYGEDLRDDDNNTESISPHPLVCLSTIRFQKDPYGQ